MTPSALWHPEAPLLRNLSSPAKSSQICCRILLTCTCSISFISWYLFGPSHSGNLAVCTKRRFKAWNKQAAETNNMVLMCHKLYLSALFQTQYSHPESCWEGRLLAVWPRHFWMNSDSKVDSSEDTKSFTICVNVVSDMKASFFGLILYGVLLHHWQTTITQFCSSKFHHPQSPGY